MTFEELNVAPDIRRAILELGFENPMPVQEKVIPLLLDKRVDVIALAQTGTGKTAAYGIPLIQEAIPNSSLPQSLILCPTRELCLQIAGDLNDFALYTDGVKIQPVYGGTSIDTQIRAIKNGVQIIVATPGRILDLIERKAVKLAKVERVVLDEADEMLNMGFLDSINAILAEIPKTRNTLLFSATMPKEVALISKKYMTNPIEVTIGSRNAGAENIKHICYTVQARDRYLALKRIADFNPGIYGIVFCRTRKETQEIADKLIQDGYNADSLHGDLSQSQRDYVMQKFRVRNISLLVATDVAARGLDVDDLTHVINYNIPDELDVYTHRSGRTGRSGKAGISIVIVHLKEKFLLKQIEKKIGKTFIQGKIPTGREICEKQLFHLIDKMEKVEIDHSEIEPYLPVIFKKLEWLDKEELIKRFVSLEFNQFLEYYRNASDLCIPEKYSDEKSGESKRGNSRKSEEGYTRLFINIGKMDGLTPNQLIDIIKSNVTNRKVKIGKIDLIKTFSFFEVESPYASDVINSLKGIEFGSRRISVEEASDKPAGENRGYERSNDRGKERSYNKSNDRGNSRGKERSYSRGKESSNSYFDKSNDRGKDRKKESSSDRNFKKERSPKNKYKPRS